jgi:hypothetical protein
MKVHCLQGWAGWQPHLPIPYGFQFHSKACRIQPPLPSTAQLLSMALCL